MIQFCDRNADDIATFLDAESTPAESLRPTTRRVTMDPIRLLEEPGERATSRATDSRSHGRATTDPAAPPARVWSAIEAVLRGDGLIS